MLCPRRNNTGQYVKMNLFLLPTDYGALSLFSADTISSLCPSLFNIDDFISSISPLVGCNLPYPR